MKKVTMGAIVSCALILGAGPGTGHAAKGGNSANAKLCQKGGWESLYLEDGTTFGSELECVAYGAQGGTIQTSPPADAAQAVCEGFGGTFGSEPLGESFAEVYWSCDGVYEIPAQQELAEYCEGTAIGSFLLGYLDCGIGEPV